MALKLGDRVILTTQAPDGTEIKIQKLFMGYDDGLAVLVDFELAHSDDIGLAD